MKKLTGLVTALSFVVCCTPYVDSAEEAEILPIYHGIETTNGGISTIKYYNENGEEQILNQPEYATLSEPLPAYYRNEEVTSVKNQLISGPCWAFAAAGAIEANLIKKGLVDKNTVDFSEAHMSYFAENPREDINLDGINYGTTAYTFGGNYLHAASLLSNKQGAADESDVPYRTYIKSSSDTMPVEEEHRYLHSAGINALHEYSANDTDAIKNAVYNYGSVCCGYYHCTDNEDSCAHYDNEKYSYHNPSTIQQNHGVLIVGWDDSYSRTNFITQPESDGAWIVKQCWGDSWGDNGYFYMSYETQIEAYSIDAHLGGTYDHNYGYTGALPMSYSYATIANVFTAENDELLEAVSVLVSVPGNADIRIFKNPKKHPDDGELLVELKDISITGLYETITLRKPIKLNKGDKFSVIVSDAAVLFEGNHDYYTADKGETYHIPFMLNYNGSNAEIRNKSIWVDASEGTCEYASYYKISDYDPEDFKFKNAAIRAFTSNITEESTPEPTLEPTTVPTHEPTDIPTVPPTNTPTVIPTTVPTSTPTAELTPEPSEVPSRPTVAPFFTPVPESGINGSITAKDGKYQVHYDNNNDFDVNFSCYIASYSDDGTILNIKHAEISIPQKWDFDFYVNLAAGDYFKIFTWTDGNMPLCDAMSMPDINSDDLYSEGA